MEYDLEQPEQFEKEEQIYMISRLTIKPQKSRQWYKGRRNSNRTE